MKHLEVTKGRLDDISTLIDDKSFPIYRKLVIVVPKPTEKTKQTTKV